jgi:hypothetical protein
MRAAKNVLRALCDGFNVALPMTTPPFQHQFLVFGEIATLTRYASGTVELQLARWSEPSEVELTEIREAFGSASLVQLPHLALVDVLPAS